MRTLAAIAITASLLLSAGAIVVAGAAWRYAEPIKPQY